MSTLVAMPARGTSVASANAWNLLNLLGYVDTEGNGDSYRLVKAKTAITAPAKKVMLFLVTGGVVTWSVAPSAALNSTLVAGVGDETLAATSVAAGDVFWVKRAGSTTVLSGASVSAVGEPVGTVTTTAGSVAEFTLPSATSAIKNQRAIIGYAISVHVTTTATCKIRLAGII